MKIQPSEITLKNGEKYLVRSALKSDAVELLKLLYQWSSETEYLLRTPVECTVTLQDEEELLEMYEMHPLRAMILAEKDGEIVASTNVYPRTELSKGVHRAVFGIAINQSEWGKGLGIEMTKLAIDTARTLGFRQLELEVFSENVRARKLYEKAGFIEYGRLKDAAKKSDGTFMDEISMVKVLL